MSLEATLQRINSAIPVKGKSSKPKAVTSREWEKVWAKAEELIKSEKTVIATTIDSIKGGWRLELAVKEFKGVTGFMPRGLGVLHRLSAPEIAPSFPVQVIEINKDRQSIIVSAKSFLVAHQFKEQADFVASLKVGDRFLAPVARKVEFGHFIRLGVIDGLLHVNDFEGTLHDKTEVEVEVKSVDLPRNRVYLRIVPPETVRKGYHPPKRVEIKDRPNVIPTMTARDLRDYIKDLSPAALQNLESFLKKRQDWLVRDLLKGNADWWTPYKEAVGALKE